MANPLFLPELREMLAENNRAELEEFCTTLHPARTADFLEGLEPSEIWAVLAHTELPRRVEIFHYFELARQAEIVEQLPQQEVAELVASLAADDRVDLLNNVSPEVVEGLLPLLTSEDRRDILHLRSYPEGTAGAMMTTEFAKLSETLTVSQALDELRPQAEHLETIYYLYIVDDQDHLRGLVSARQLVSAMGRPATTLKELMETEVVTALVTDDQEEVAQRVARYDLLAIPVVDSVHKMLGIITHDDVMDVVRVEATEDAHRSAAVAPLTESYLRTSLWTLSWKRGVWLAILFVGSLATASALSHYERDLKNWEWLVLFIPMVISCGGNTGNQSATLIITGLTSGDLSPSEWRRILLRELILGVCLGLCLGGIGLMEALVLADEARQSLGILVVPLTILIVVTCGALCGSLLPLLFRKLGLDPALMSNPFVAGLMDIMGIIIYMQVAQALLT